MAFFANVRYGKMRHVARFRVEQDDLSARDACIVKSERGRELGEVLTRPEAIPEGAPFQGAGEIVRRATPEDLERIRRIESDSRGKAAAYTTAQIAHFRLPMKLVDVEILFGGEKIIFFFVSATRVDFRELVRVLAGEFRTRIELKQIGARDSARILGDIGPCGLRLCCQGFLKDLGGITMEMAKVQKQTVDPSKVCGSCGKLMCCLSYEYKNYVEARKDFPSRGARIGTPKGPGVVLSNNLLQGTVWVDVEGGERTTFRLDELSRLAPPPPAAAPSGGTAGPPPEGGNRGGKGCSKCPAQAGCPTATGALARA